METYKWGLVGHLKSDFVNSKLSWSTLVPFDHICLTNSIVSIVNNHVTDAKLVTDDADPFDRRGKVLLLCRYFLARVRPNLNEPECLTVLVGKSHLDSC